MSKLGHEPEGILYILEDDLEEMKIVGHESNFGKKGIEELEKHLGKHAAFSLWEAEPGPNIPSPQPSESKSSERPYRFDTEL